MHVGGGIHTKDLPWDQCVHGLILVNSSQLFKTLVSERTLHF